MAGLRWILLLVGAAFLLALAAWEKRKPRQARPEAAPGSRQRNEPDFGSLSEQPKDAHAPGARGGSQGSLSDARRPVLPPPRIDLPAMEAIRDQSMMAEVDALPVFDFEPRTSDAGPARQVEQTAAALPEAPHEVQARNELSAAVAPPPAPAAPAPLLVDWPPDGERHIVALRIVPASEERLSGRAVRLAITACGFVHGRFGIFHQPDADGRALLSVASLSKPGILDPINMDFQRLTGISLFAVLPGPLAPAAALDHLVGIARELSLRLPARVQDEQGQPLDADRLEDLRDSMQRLSRPGMHAEPAA
jgi:FtsZ-interacting cell division protein ZipA